MSLLKGIACGLLGTFVSRNNDINGYWGLGVLRLHAERMQASELTIDLLKEDLVPDFRSPVATTKQIYRQVLTNVLAKSHIDTARLKKVEINLRFANFEEFPNAIRDTRGEPYLCTVSITGKNGSIYEARKLGCCAPHDP